MSEEILKHNQDWYRKVYYQIINKAKLRGLDKKSLNYYVEIHHIIPKCLGGTDDKDNLVALTYREHIICHKILCRLYPDNYYLHSSIYLMLHVKIENGKKVKTFSNSKEAERYKLFLKSHKKPLSDETKKKMSKAHRGWVPSEEFRKKVSERQKGKKVPREIIDKLREINLGRHHTEESKKKMSESKKGKKLSEEHKKNISMSLKGIKRKSPSKEQIEKAKETRIRNGGWVHTEESRKKISESLKKRNESKNHISQETRDNLRKRFGFAVRYTDPKTDEIMEFDSVSEAVKKLKELSIMDKSFKYIKKCCTLKINGFEFINETNTMIQKKVQGPDGTIYNSISDCARKLKTVRSVIIDWINNHIEKGFKFL